MAQLINASIDFTELMLKAKAAHSAFTRGKKNGKAYVSLTIWVNDEPDKYGNDAAIQLNSSKEKRSTEGTVYVGHGRVGDKKPGKKKEINTAEYKDDLPF